MNPLLGLKTRGLFVLANEFATEFAINRSAQKINQAFEPCSARNLITKHIVAINTTGCHTLIAVSTEFYSIFYRKA